MTLRLRLPLFFFLVVAVGAGTTYILARTGTGSAFRSFVYSGDAEKAGAYAAILGGYREETGSWKGVQDFVLAFPRLASGMHGGAKEASYDTDLMSALMTDRLVVADEAGVVVADSAGRLLGSVHEKGHLDHGAPILAKGARAGTVLVGSMIDSGLSGQAERLLASIGAAVFGATLVSALLALALGLFLSYRIAGPLASLDAAVRRVAAGDLAASVPVSGRDELAALGASFNAMTAELVRLEEARKRLIADAAHELRTPVTLIRGNVEAMLDGVFPRDDANLRAVHDETLRLSRLIDTLRELELIDSGQLVLELEDVDLGESLRRAASLFAAAAKEKGIALSLELPETGPLRVRADYLRLEEVVYNLLSNAIKFTPPGGRVVLSAEAGALWAVLRVDDTGPGVPPEERERVFERFYRLDKSRSSDSGGRGLGLAIASEIVKAHGGSLRAEDGRLGGASFAAELPTA